MGLKVACPNGHRLVVKEELAGKRGICPKCKTSFVITAAQPEAAEQKPAARQSSETKPTPSKPAAQQPAAGKPAEPKPQKQPAASGPAPPKTVPTKTTPTKSAPAGGSQSSGKLPTKDQKKQPSTSAVGTKSAPADKRAAATSKDKPKSGAAAQTPPDLPAANGAGEAPNKKASAGAVDPIAEAPHLAWYVRHPNGSKYGPAKGELMRQWVAEGRVGADSLTWREGWKEWQRADQVFPQLGTGTVESAPAQPTQPVQKKASEPAQASANRAPQEKSSPQEATQETPVEPLTRRGQARRKRQQMRLILSGVLLLIVIGLGVTLTIVLTR